MICLECGAELPYPSPRCSCGYELPAPPPFMHANHVSQMQHCLDRCLAGEMSPPELQERYQRFAALFSEFEGRWEMLSGPPLEERLAPAMQERYHSGVMMLARGFDYLAQAMEALEGAMETGRTADLEYARELLGDYFRVTCQATAVLVYELEQSQNEQPGPGRLLDLKSS